MSRDKASELSQVDVRNKKFINHVKFFLLWSTRRQLPGAAPMHVGVRPTWLNSEALSRDKDDFLRKGENTTIYVR